VQCAHIKSKIERWLILDFNINFFGFKQHLAFYPLWHLHRHSSKATVYLSGQNKEPKGPMLSKKRDMHALKSIDGSCHQQEQNVTFKPGKSQHFASKTCVC